MNMTSSKPYFLRSLNEWILDNGCTPYLIVNAECEGVVVPREYVKDGQIVLNIAPLAVRGLAISNEYVLFNGRFNGLAMDVTVPVEAVLGIIAKENGEGMWFPVDPSEPEPDNDGSGESVSKTDRQTDKKKPNLKIIK